MDAVFDDFAKAVRSRRDYRQSAGERFQTSIGKWIINRRQNEDVRSRIKTRDVSNFAEKPYRFLAPKAKPRGFVESFISAARNEQTQFSVFAERHGLDCKKQPFAFPAGARKQQRNLVRLQFQIFAGFFAKLRIEPERIEWNAVANDVDVIGGIGIKVDDLVSDHF